MDGDVLQPQSEPSAHGHHARTALHDVRHRLRRRALELVGLIVVAYAVLKLVPALKQALHAFEHASWEWVLALLALEVLSEVGFVVAWSAIVDPQNILAGDEGGRGMDQNLAWLQLGGGLVLPGGSWGGMGIDSLILHRFGMPTKVIAERQFNLSFLNTAIDALALVVFGVGLATGVLAGESNLLLTLLPAAVAGAGIAGAVLIARTVGKRTDRPNPKHPKIAAALATLAAAVRDTQRLLLDRAAWAPILGVVAYLGGDALVLWFAFSAVHANPIPGFPIAIMAYIIGALGGSIPLPAAAGTIGGMAGMLILYGVGHNNALAAVLLHQAIGLLVPLVGGGISYAILRRRFGPLRPGAATDAAVAQTNAGGT